MAMILVCDECGKPATTQIYVSTGRVIIDGRDKGQSVDLCDEHHDASSVPYQARNCVRVKIQYSSGDRSQ